jgi:hypothetical protein
MSQASIKLTIPFDLLINALAALDLKEKRQIWEWLGKQLTQAEMREPRTDYLARDNLTRKADTAQPAILEELKKLTSVERLIVIETALHLIRADIQKMDQQSPAWIERKQQLATAAASLLPDYTTDYELTSFTVLDNQEFHE